MQTSIVQPTQQKLTHRERFRRQMHYLPIDRGVHWEFGYLNETIQRWHEEGLPAHIKHSEWHPESVEAYFGVEPRRHLPIQVGMMPGFEGKSKVLREDDRTVVVESPDGTIAEHGKGPIVTIPHYIKMPISNREDWQKFKERHDPAYPERHKVDWKQVGEETKIADIPIGVHIGSFFGWIRNWVGFAELGMMTYDDPDLVEEMVETLTVLKLSQLEECLKYCQVDYAEGWEDICFRNGPMVSPAYFRSVVGPRLKRVCDLLRKHGVDVIWTDCDGDITALVPIMLEAGMNCMFPLEVHGGSDPVALRKQYGKQILLRGGLEKYELTKSRQEILAELKRVEGVFNEGGFIPSGDHRIPQDVPYDNYRFYIKEKLNMMGWSKDDIEAIEPLKGKV